MCVNLNLFATAQVEEVAVKPVGFAERVRRKSVELVLGADAAPDAASLAALLGECNDEQDDFEGFCFGGQDTAAATSSQDPDRALALKLFQEHDVDGASVLRCAVCCTKSHTRNDLPRIG